MEVASASWLLVDIATHQVVSMLDGVSEYSRGPSPSDQLIWVSSPSPAYNHHAVPDGAGGFIAERRPLSLQEVRDTMRQAVDDRLAQWFSAGFRPSHPAFTGETLQTRNMEDRTNWLTSQAAYSAQVMAGNGAVEGADFRTASNAIITLSFAEGNDVLLEMAGWGASGMGNSWRLKDAILAAEDSADFDAIDIESGWPG